MRRLTRREFLQSTAATGVLLSLSPEGVSAAEDPWERGPVKHLLPLCNHDTILVKASFREPFDEAPVLHLGDRSVAGIRMDGSGRFFRFHCAALTADTEYELAIHDDSGGRLCDAWPLRTMPRPDAAVDHFRLAVYTCAGGLENVPLRGSDLWIPIAQRQRMFERILSFQPHAVVGVGDQVYWDQITGVYKYVKMDIPDLRESIEAQWDRFGRFERNLPMLGSANETVLTRVVDEQLAELYGVRFRSVPTILTQDDHDYFENDEATDEFIAFPPDAFMMRAARATQRLYFPEFLPDANRPAGLGATDAAPDPYRLGEAYGTLRYGKLFEGLLYDCRRFVTLGGPSARFIGIAAEHWLRDRMLAQDATYVVNMPSTPLGWSAGKFGEWYPDVNVGDGRLGTSTEKPYWQSGWFEQHQRIASYAHSMKGLPLFISGDLHAVGGGSIVKSGDLDLRANPLVSILSGPISSGGGTFATTFRGIGATPPTALEVRETYEPLEKNGFTIFDFTPERVSYMQFAWRGELGDPIELIDSMDPVYRGEHGSRL